MTHRLLLCALVLWCIGATTIPSRPPAHGVRDTVEILELQPANLRKDQCYVITDGLSNTDCGPVGGGTQLNICCSDGVTWTAVGGGGGAGSFDLNFAGDSGSGVITDAETLTITGGNGVVTTAAVNDLNIVLDLNATLDGVGLTTSLAGLEFTATNELALIQGCANNEILKWVDAGATWDCAADQDTGSTINSFETWDAPAGTDPVASSGTDTMLLTQGVGIVVTGNSAVDSLDFDFDYSSTLAGAPGLGAEECVFTTDGTGSSGAIICEGSVADGFEFLLLFPDAVGLNKTDTIVLEVETQTLQNKTLNATNVIQAGAYDAASIDGDDIVSTLAGDGLILTVAAPDTLDIDLNATLDGVGSTSNLSGLEFTATAELALLQGCSNGEILKWVDAGATWDCAADSDSGAINSFETWNVNNGTNPVADSSTDTINFIGTGIDIFGTAATDTMLFTFDSTEVFDTTWGGAGGAPTPTITWTFDTDTPSDLEIIFQDVRMFLSGSIILDDGVGDSPAFTMINANNTSYSQEVQNATDNLRVEVNDSGARAWEWRNIGAGNLNIDADGTLILGVPATSAIAGAGAYVAASIDGDDINSNLAGDGLILTAASPDTLDVDLNATLDGVGSVSNLAGMEFTATAELALLQGCANNEILKWADAGATWDCSADNSGGGGANSFETWNTPAGTNPVAESATDTINIESSGGILITGTAGTDTADFTLDLNATLDGVGSSSNLSGLEFTATSEVALLQGCADNQILKWNDTPATWDCEADVGANHAILSATHTDSLAAAVSRGSIIVGNTTPAWSELVVGAAGTRLFSDGTDATWVDSDTAAFLLAGTVFATVDGGIVIDTDGDNVEVIDDVLAVQSGGIDYHIPMMRTFPTSNNHVIALNRTTDQYVWKPMTSGNGISIAGTASNITVNMVTEGVNAIHDATVPTTAENSLGIDTDGDGVNILNDVLSFRSDSENFFIPAPREYPTVDGQVLKFNATNDDWEWGTDNDTQLTQEQVEDFAGNLVANATGTHTGLVITYQDGTGDMDFVIGGGDGIIANANDLAVDLNATLDGVGATSNLSGMEFTATAELALLQGCADNEILKWEDTGATWDCAADATAAGMTSFDITDTDASPILTVNDAEQIQFIGGTAITVVAAADGANHDVTFSCDAATATTTGCLEQATQAEADAGTAGNLAVIASVLEAWNGGSNIVTVGTIATGVWNGTALTDAFVSDTLTASLFVGSGSTTTAIDLATAEVAGVLPDGNVADTLTIGASSTIAAGAYTAASIDGDDINTNIAGDGLILTSAAPDTLDIDLNATLDGVGSSSNLSGMEFTATAELALLQGCADGQILKWVDAGATWDCAADADSGGSPALSSVTDPVGDVSFTFTDGEEIDWVMTSTGPTGTDVFHINFNQPDDADATDDIDVFMINIALESGDAGDTVRAMRIALANGTANTVLDAAIQITNEETTAATMTDAIRIISPGVDGGIVDAIDVAAANIDNAINIGANNIITGSATIAAAELNRLDGLVGVIGTDAVAVTDLDGRGLLITAAVLELDLGAGLAFAADQVRVDSLQTGFIRQETSTPVNDGALTIDTNGDGVNILNDVLQFQSGSEDFFVPAPREYPTANAQLVKHNSTNDDWEYGFVLITELAVGTKANLESVLSDVADIAEADGDTWTGVHDFGGATSLEIVNGAAPVVDAVGEIVVDTTNVPAVGGRDQLVYESGDGDVSMPGIKAGCFTIEDLAAADDDYEFWTTPYAVTILSAYCTYSGTATLAATIDFLDGEGNAMTMTDATCVDADSSTRPTVQAVTAANALVVGESLAFNVTNAVAPETMTHRICFTYAVTRQ